MTNKKWIALLALSAAVMLSGCGGEKKAAPETTADTAAQTEEQAATEPAITDVSEPESEEALDPITPSDYLVKNASEYVTLGSLDGLTATQTVYEITDDMVQERIEEEMYMYSEETEVEKAADGNIVYADVTSSIQGEEGSEFEESTYFTIGDADYGEEFDKQLVGCAVGDELSFSVTYGDDTWFEEWIGQTVDFKVTVTGVFDLVIPEYDDDFVSTYTDYASKDEYESAVREMLESEYQESSYTETANALFQSVMDLSTFNGYPEDLYASCEEEMLTYYGQFIGEDDKDVILDAFGITKEDLQEDIMNSVNLQLLISALCEENGLEVTADEYVSEVTADAESYGYMSAVEYEADSSRASIVRSMYENKAAAFLYDAAEITTVTASAEEEEAGLEDGEVLNLDDEDFLVEEESSESELSEDEITPAETAENSSGE